MEISIEDMANQIMKGLWDYEAGVQKTLEKHIRLVAKETKEDLMVESPKRTSVYAYAWKYTKQTRHSQASYIVHNEEKYQITQLLEYEHDSRNKDIKVKAYPHIAPVEKRAVEKLERLLKDDL